MLSAFKPKTIGIISAIIGFGSFACADACAKWLGAHYDTPSVILWTYVLSLIFGLMLSPWLGGVKRTLGTNHLPVHIGRGVCSLGIAACVVTAMTMGMPLANLYTILFLAPFLIALTAWPVYKEPVPMRDWGIIALGFSGILIAFRPGYDPISVEEMFAFGALGFIVALSMLARPLDERESLHSLSFYPSIVIIALVAPLLWGDLALPAPEHWGVFALNGLFVIGGLSGIANGFRKAPYSIVAPLHYLQMVIAIVIGYLVFSDLPDVWMVSGAGVIILSGLWLVWSNRRDRH